MQSNKFFWHQHETIGQHPKEKFTIRSLKQGSTGAVKTWPCAPILLEYLVLRNGLCQDTTSVPLDAPLDMTESPKQMKASSSDDHYNIVELGAGTGYLGIGLALSINHDNRVRNDLIQHNDNSMGSSCSPKLRIMCTDSDKQTMKNMRYNVHEQSREKNLTKAVRVQSLSWGADIGGIEFSNAVKSHFGSKDNVEEDPLRLITHLIASDVHFGTHTLEPLSSVIAAFKLRVPDGIVIALLRDRSAESCVDVSQLKATIEAKVERGRRQVPNDDACGTKLNDFSVHVREVRHGEVEHMKLVEC